VLSPSSKFAAHLDQPRLAPNAKERAIIFTGPMLQALQSGRKTQTRRIIKENELGSAAPADVPCPYGRAGDVLWVKETFRRDGAKIIWGADHPDHPGPWTSPLFLKRKKSRIVLRLASTAIESLHDISDADIEAEGIPLTWTGTPRDWFKAQWESVHGADSWALNPLTWVLRFHLVD